MLFKIFRALINGPLLDSHEFTYHINVLLKLQAWFVFIKPRVNPTYLLLIQYRENTNIGTVNTYAPHADNTRSFFAFFTAATLSK